MLWIGLTGSMGSGKSTVARLLRQRGFPVLDADEIVHTLLRPGGAVEASVISTFGGAVRGADGHLERRALGRIVFNDPQKLERLEGILHPKVREVVAGQRSRLEASGHAAAFYDVPLLFEKGMEAQFDAIVVVSAAEDIRRRRINSRMNLTDAEIDQRFSRQVDPMIKEQKASVVIRNDGTEDDLAREVSAALSALGLVSPAAADT